MDSLHLTTGSSHILFLKKFIEVASQNSLSLHLISIPVLTYLSNSFPDQRPECSSLWWRPHIALNHLSKDLHRSLRFALWLRSRSILRVSGRREVAGYLTSVPVTLPDISALDDSKTCHLLNRIRCHCQCRFIDFGHSNEQSLSKVINEKYIYLPASKFRYLVPMYSKPTQNHTFITWKWRSIVPPLMNGLPRGAVRFLNGTGNPV